jgi:hypothetical protein
MALRAKMRVSSVTKSYREVWNKPEAGIVETMELKLTVVGSKSGTEDPNKAWSASTPSGEIRLLVANLEAFPFIEAMPGKEFYVDISPVDES